MIKIFFPIRYKNLLAFLNRLIYFNLYLIFTYNFPGCVRLILMIIHGTISKSDQIIFRTKTKYIVGHIPNAIFII